MSDDMPLDEARIEQLQKALDRIHLTEEQALILRAVALEKQCEVLDEQMELHGHVSRATIEIRMRCLDAAMKITRAKSAEGVLRMADDLYAWARQPMEPNLTITSRRRSSQQYAP